MFILEGKYNTAKIFTDLVDNESISQVINMLNQPFAEGQTIRMMPDIHAGAGCTIGTTMTVTDKVCPNLIGVDIGCGMYVIQLEEKSIDFELLDKCIRQYVPSGFSIRETPHKNVKSTSIEDLYCSSNCDLLRAEKSIGTLGGGNHFIEVDRDEEGNLWLVIHSGSRHLGMEVASFYQKSAVKNLHEVPHNLIQDTIQRLKEEGRHKEIQDTLQKLKSPFTSVPDSLCWCDGYLFDHYVHDMKITQEFANINRKTIAEVIMHHMNLHKGKEEFTTIHNYLDTDSMILRKGAVSAKSGETLLIPMNMRDGSLICVGKGNADWNYSAPHGAGRLMSRSEARKQIDMEEFKNSMANVWTTSVGTGTIDEAPMAYKPMESIVSNISDTVKIVNVIKPVYNFKASDCKED